MYNRKFFINCLLTLVPFVIGWFINIFPALKELYLNYRVMVDLIVMFIWIGIGWQFAMSFKDTALGLIVGNFVWGISFFAFMMVNLYGMSFLGFMDDFSLTYVYNFAGVGGSIVDMFNVQSGEYALVIGYIFMFVLFSLGFFSQRLLLKAVKGPKK